MITDSGENGEGQNRLKHVENIKKWLSPARVRRERDQTVERPSEAAMARVSAEGSTPRTEDNVLWQRL